MGNLKTNTDLTNKLVVYEKSDDIRINASDLKLEFIHFKKAVSNTISLSVFLAVISVWVTSITADFKPIFGINSDIVYGAYLMFSIIVTIVLINPLFARLKKALATIDLIRNKIQFWLELNEIDPETKVNAIQRKCLNLTEKNK